MSPRKRNQRHLRALVLSSAIGAIAINAGPPALAAQEDAAVLRVETLTQDQADAIIDEFNRTGLVKGSDLPTKHTDFQNEPPSELFQLANDIRETHGNDAGYGPLEWLHESRTARLWWYGELPADVASATIQTASTTGLTIANSAMTHSLPELNQAATEILLSQEAKDLGIVTATALHDGSGLEIGLESHIGTLTPSEVTDSSDLGTSENYPVSVTISGDVETTNNRQGGQVAPYAGGARIHGSSSACTAAFGVMIQNPVAGRSKPRGMLTAHHCGNYGPGIWGTPSSRFYGYKTSEYATGARDAAVLVNDSRRSGVSDTFRLYYPMMYTGAWDAGNRNIVVGGQTPIIGADWCFSGSYSGTWCYNRIQTVNTFVNYGGPSIVGPLVRTANYKNQIPVGNGDSGGPAFRYRDASSNGVFATGIISGMQNPTSSCSGVKASAGRKCSKIALISPVYGAMASMNGGLTLMTNTNY